MRSSATEEEAILLTALTMSVGPLGSRGAWEVLREAGVAVSESTASRFLQRLDAKGLTEPVGRKGRRLTAVGRARAEEILLDRRRADAFRFATDVTSLQDLLDLLHARRGVEREAARAAALRATPEDIERLSQMVEQHQCALSDERPVRQGALEFHRVIGEISGNRLLLGLYQFLFAPALDRTESLLDIVVGTHSSAPRTVSDHRVIVDAIASGDPDRAEHAVVDHMDQLIRETEQFAVSGSADMIDRLLTWVNSDEYLPSETDAAPLVDATPS